MFLSDNGMIIPNISLILLNPAHSATSRITCSIFIATNSENLNMTVYKVVVFAGDHCGPEVNLLKTNHPAMAVDQS